MTPGRGAPAFLEEPTGVSYGGGAQRDNMNDIAYYSQSGTELFTDDADSMGSTKNLPRFQHLRRRKPRMVAHSWRGAGGPASVGTDRR